MDCQDPNMRKAPQRADELIIDGYNVIFRLARAAVSRPDQMRQCRAELEEALETLGRREDLRPRLFYDGEHGVRRTADPVAHSHVQVSYVEPPAEADDAIVQMAGQLTRAGRRVIVVTADRELARRVRDVGGRVQGVDEFRARLEQGAGPEPPPGGDLGVAGPPSGGDRIPAAEATFLALHRRNERIEAFITEQDRRLAGSGGEEERPGECEQGAVGIEQDSQPDAIAGGPGAGLAEHPGWDSRPGSREAKKARGRRRQARRLQQLASRRKRKKRR